MYIIQKIDNKFHYNNLVSSKNGIKLRILLAVLALSGSKLE